jgi:hypothetical protein
LPPLVLDSGAPTVKVKDYMAAEARFRMVERMDPARFERLAVAAQQETDRRLKVYDHLAHLELAQRATPTATVTKNGGSADAKAPLASMKPVEPIAPIAPAVSNGPVAQVPAPTPAHKN